MPKPKPKPDLDQLFGLDAVRAVGNPGHDDVSQLTIGVLRVVRDRFGEPAAIEAAKTMVNMAASVLSCMVGIERAIRVLEMNVEAIEQAGGPSGSR